MSNRSNVFFGAMALVGGVAGGLLGSYLFHASAVVAADNAPVARNLRAQSLSLVDGDGMERAALKIERDGLVRLSFFNMKGQRRIALGVLGDGEPALGLFDSGGEPRIGMNIPIDDSAGFRLLDANGKSRLRMGQMRDGETALELLDESGKVIWSTPAGGQAAQAAPQAPPSTVSAN